MPGNGMILRLLLDLEHVDVGDLVEAAALAFDHDEDCLYHSSGSWARSSKFGYARRTNSGT